MRNRGTGPGRFIWMGMMLLVAYGVPACDTKGLLEVDLPGNVTAEDVESPSLATTMRNASIGDFEWAWDTYVNYAARHSDEYIHSSGNFTARRQLLRDIPGDLGAYQTTVFGRWHTARMMLERNYERLMGFTDAQVPNRARYLAEMRTYGGFVYVAFGEGFCGTPLNGDGNVRTPAQLLNIAVEQFTEAMQLAQAANRQDLVNAARIGRARAYLGLGQYGAAVSDAELIPEGFTFYVTRDASQGRRENSMAATNRLQSNQAATVAPGYRDVRWKDVPDPRVNVTNTGFVGHDNSTIVWRHDKTPAQGGQDQDVVLASWREARLFIAEAAAVTGDLERAREILNFFHDRAGIPPVTVEDTPTQNDVIRHVIEERRRELFVEGGHRHRDQVRWMGTEFHIPFLGEPGSDHPDGVDQYGQVYGSTTCFPVAQNEQVG
jgi:starch-binding outer membrane protein, SusD/RagB family